MQEAFETRPRTPSPAADAPGGLIDGHTELAKAYVLKVFPDPIGLGRHNREMLIRFGHAHFNMFGPKNGLYASRKPAVEVFEWVAVNASERPSSPAASAWRCTRRPTPARCTRRSGNPPSARLLGGSDTTIYSIGNTIRALARTRTSTS